MQTDKPAVSESVPSNAWSFVRRAIEYGVAIEQDSRKQGRTYDQHSAAIDLRASILANELKAHFTILQQALDAKTRENEQLRNRVAELRCELKRSKTCARFSNSEESDV